MSPEQLDSRPVDARADVYGLGLSIYEMATGEMAIQGRQRAQLTTEVLHGNPRLPSSIASSIPRDLETIILKAIAKSSIDRYDTAGELSDDLQRFLEHRAIKARRTTKSEHLRHLVKRNPATALLSAMIVLLQLVVSVGSSVLAANSIADSKEKELALYAQEMQQANQATRQGRFLTAQRLLLNWVPESSNRLDHRGFEWFHLWQRSHDPAIERTISYQLPVYNVEFVKNSTRLAVAGWSDRVDIWNLNQSPLTNPEQRASTAFGAHAVAKLHQRDAIVLGDRCRCPNDLGHDQRGSNGRALGPFKG